MVCFPSTVTSRSWLLYFSDAYNNKVKPFLFKMVCFLLFLDECVNFGDFRKKTKVCGIALLLMRLARRGETTRSLFMLGFSSPYTLHG